MPQSTINVRIRLIVIKDEKILLMYYSTEDFYFYIGGRLEYGESISECIQREVEEECGEGSRFHFKKILYIRDFISQKRNEHSVELFVLGDIDSPTELEGRKDNEEPDTKWLTWRNINDLPKKLYPTKLIEKLVADYKNGFPNQGEYIGSI